MASIEQGNEGKRCQERRAEGWRMSELRAKTKRVDEEGRCSHPHVPEREDEENM